MQFDHALRLGILEDDEFQVAIYQLLFSPTQYRYEFFGTVASFLEAIEREKFDLFIIDWMLPDGTAEVVLKWIRQNLRQHVPVICITARNSESDVVNALHLGADDYFVKSSRNFELLARVESLVRRNRTEQPSAMRVGPYELDRNNQKITVAGKNASLTHKEFELASYLLQNTGKLLSRVHLMEKIWGLGADIDTRTVDTHVSRIRNKLNLSSQGDWDIETVYGFGYRFQQTETAKAVKNQ